jgi:hypothetical protein
MDRIPDCRPSNFNELPDEVKSLYVTAEELPEKFMVQCDFEGMRDIRVITSNNHITSILDIIKSKGVKTVYLQALGRMLAYHKISDNIYKKGGKIWDELCFDIVIYYCCRVLLFNKPIPIVKM